MPFSLLKAGDWIVLLLGMLLTVWLAQEIWRNGAADKAIIRSGGKTFREVSLMRDQTIDVPGPLGISVITIRNREARVVSDPGPRQYCVLQGWLKHAGEAAICLPNQVSLELRGAEKIYDSLNY